MLPMFYGVLSKPVLGGLVEDSTSSTSNTKIARRSGGTYYETTDSQNYDVFDDNGTDGRFYGNGSFTSYVINGGSGFAGVFVIIGDTNGSVILSCDRSDGELKDYLDSNSFGSPYTYTVPSGFRESMSYDSSLDTAVFVGAGDVNGTILVVTDVTAASGQTETYYESSTISSPTGVTFDNATNKLVLVDGTNKVFATLN